MAMVIDRLITIAFACKSHILKFMNYIRLIYLPGILKEAGGMK